MKKLLQKFLDALLACPQSLSDYVAVGRWLIYKKLLAILGLLILAAAVAVPAWMLRPAKPFALPVFHVGEEKLEAFSGEAVVLDGEESVVYRGGIASGLYSGNGKQFGPKGDLLYEGGFLEGRHSGEGILYLDGAAVYRGGFLNGEYSGRGNLYSGETAVYEGEFSAGRYHGRGTLYEQGRKRYEGGFLEGLYSGEGVLYDGEGHAVYSGDFARGKREGSGTETAADDSPVYEGGFRDGLYNGQGSLFARDGTRLMFEGTFVQGKPGRRGGIYNARGQLLYSGAVFKGGVDYISLAGRKISELDQDIRELPTIYYNADQVGYLYRELGFAVVARHSRPAGPEPEPPAPESAAGEDIAADSASIDTSLFDSPEDGLVANTLLIDGVRFADQLPPDAVEVPTGSITGFEAFMEARLARVRDPAYPQPFADAAVTARGDHLFEVESLPDETAYDGKRLFQDELYYAYRAGAFDKGGIPSVVLCSKAKFGW